MAARHVPVGRAHPNERRGIRTVVDALPSTYVVYSNVELATGRSGGTYEHDLLVLAPHAVFTVELKSWGGRISGNRDRWQLEGGGLVHSPIPLTLKKARILASQLRAAGARGAFVQGLVFVTGVDARLDLSRDYGHLVATCDDIVTALTDPRAFDLSSRFIERAHRRIIERLFSDGAPASWGNRVGPYELLDRLSPPEGAAYELWRAKRLGGVHQTLHVYRIHGASGPQREQQRNRALREANLLERLRGGPDLLDYRVLDEFHEPDDTYILAFEDTGGFTPLAGWLERHAPGLDERLTVAERLTRALQWVHGRGIVHRRLSPEAVLVSDERQPESVRLCALELARDLSASVPTVSRTDLADASVRCMSPELLRTNEATRRSDRFALGATLFELFNERPLFDKPEDALRPYNVPPLHIGDTPVPDDIALVVSTLLDPDPMKRPEPCPAWRPLASPQKVQQCSL